MKTRLHGLTFIVIVTITSLATSCGVWDTVVSTPIAEILNNPHTYDGKDVTVVGRVTEVTNLLVVRYYKVKDRTGEIVVVPNRATPNCGDSLAVKGTVREAFAIGDLRMIVLVEKDQ